MRPVRPGTRGPAVEDIQRRLLALGYDLGPTGVDGVFLGLTTEAVRSFQREHELGEDGVVGTETWSTLVDAGFRFGDRMLYLRLPHFHGRDVQMLQQALNVLGFACGATDGIFGAFSERAVREFQRNAGLPDDGIVGPDTARTITNLRHVWEGKDALSHSAAKASPARAAEVLARTDVAVGGRDASGLRIAERVVNLARATTDAAKIHLADSDESAAVSSFTLTLCDAGVVGAVPGRPHVRLDDADAFATRLVTAVAAARNGLSEVVIELPASTLPDEREDQRSAVLILDALCVAFD